MTQGGERRIRFGIGRETGRFEGGSSRYTFPRAFNIGHISTGIGEAFQTPAFLCQKTGDGPHFALELFDVSLTTPWT